MTVGVSRHFVGAKSDDLTESGVCIRPEFADCGSFVYNVGTLAAARTSRRWADVAEWQTR